MATRQTLTAKKPAAAPIIEAALVNLGPYPFPKRSDFVFDFPRAADFAKADKGNAAGVSASWSNEKVRAARMEKHGVRVTFSGVTTEHKSVAAAFRALRLPFEKHIKFRLGLKASGKETFTHNDQLYMFVLAE